MPEIKFCGTMSAHDVEVARLAEADTVGFVCRPDDRVYAPSPSSHTITASEGAELVQGAAGLTTVLLPHTTRDVMEISAMCDQVRPDRVQLGETSDPRLAETLRELNPGIEIAQVIHVSRTLWPGWIDRLIDCPDVINLDTPGEKAGGTGRTHDWAISREICDRAHEAGKRVLLGGGLADGNLRRAVKTVRPDGLDVESFIKGRTGRNSLHKGRQFVNAARAAFEAQGMLK